MQSNISIVEDIVRSWPTLLEEMRLLRYGPKSRAGRDPTATAATAKLPAEKQRHYDAIDSAQRQTRSLYEDGMQRMKMIAAVYWDSPADPILEKISAATAEEWKRDFLNAVSEQLGIRSCTGCVYWKPLYWNGIKSCQFCYETGKPRIYDDDRCYSKKLAEIQELPALQEGGAIA